MRWQASVTASRSDISATTGSAPSAAADASVRSGAGEFANHLGTDPGGGARHHVGGIGEVPLDRRTPIGEPAAHTGTDGGETGGDGRVEKTVDDRGGGGHTRSNAATASLIPP